MPMRALAEANLEQIRNVDFWRPLGGGLHLQDAEFLGRQSAFAWDPDLLASLRNVLREDGYLQLPPQPWDLPIEAMADLIRALDRQGLPLPFSFLYDEFWALYWRLDKLIEALLGPGYLRLPDFWTWLVDPQRGQSGWKPHRDKNWNALFPDRSPKSITVWIPLSHATPLNSCIYAVPAHRDPTYGTPADQEWRHQPADVRALPADAGSVLLWTQALLHWGSSASPRETQPRISVAFEFQSGQVEPMNQPLTRPDQLPSHDMRLALIGQQILQYRHMYPLPPALEALARKLIGLRAAATPAAAEAPARAAQAESVLSAPMPPPPGS